MVFKSDRQRKGFFASRGNVRSNVNPQLLTKAQAKQQLKAETGGLIQPRRRVFVDGTLVTAKGKKVPAVFFGSRGGDLFGTAIKVKGGYVNIDNRRKIPTRLKPFFPFSSVKKTTFVDLPFGGRKERFG